MAKYTKDWTTEDYEESNFERIKKKGGNPKKKHVKDNKRKGFVDNSEINW